MKKLITTDISGNVRAPFIKPALNNLQDNFTEIPASLAEALIGSGYDPGVIYIFKGVVFSLTTTSTANDTLHWTAGAMYNGGEFYQIAAGSVVKTADTFVFRLVDSITNATFSDGNSYPWIENITYTFVQGVDGVDGIGYNTAAVIRLPGESFRLVGGAGQPAFSNSFISLSGLGVRTLQFRKITSGKVEIQGVCSRASDTTGAKTIFTLPSGYFDTVNNIQLSVMLQPEAGGDLVPGNLIITTTGAVEVISTTNYATIIFGTIYYYL